MNIKLLCVASGIILLLAIVLSWPYSYYILLRWAIFASSIIVAIGFYNSKVTGWALVFGAVAFLFNPIFPVYLTRQTWTPIDLISAVLFFIAGFSKKK
jgi:hypothetical protein